LAQENLIEMEMKELVNLVFPNNFHGSATLLLQISNSMTLKLH